MEKQSLRFGVSHPQSPLTSENLGISNARHDELMAIVEAVWTEKDGISEILGKVSESAQTPQELAFMSLQIGVIKSNQSNPFNSTNIPFCPCGACQARRAAVQQPAEPVNDAAGH